MRTTLQPVFRRGSEPREIPFIGNQYPWVIAFARSYENQDAVVVLNHSRQAVDLTLNLPAAGIEENPLPLHLNPWGVHIEVKRQRARSELRIDPPNIETDVSRTPPIQPDRVIEMYMNHDNFIKSLPDMPDRNTMLRLQHFLDLERPIIEANALDMNLGGSSPYQLLEKALQQLLDPRSGAAELALVDLPLAEVKLAKSTADAQLKVTAKDRIKSQRTTGVEEEDELDDIADEFKRHVMKALTDILIPTAPAQPSAQVQASYHGPGLFLLNVTSEQLEEQLPVIKRAALEAFLAKHPELKGRLDNLEFSVAHTRIWAPRDIPGEEPREPKYEPDASDEKADIIEKFDQHTTAKRVWLVYSGFYWLQKEGDKRYPDAREKAVRFLTLALIEMMKKLMERTKGLGVADPELKEAMMQTLKIKPSPNRTFVFNNPSVKVLKQRFPQRLRLDFFDAMANGRKKFMPLLDENGLLPRHEHMNEGVRKAAEELKKAIAIYLGKPSEKTRKAVQAGYAMYRSRRDRQFAYSTRDPRSAIAVKLSKLGSVLSADKGLHPGDRTWQDWAEHLHREFKEGELATLVFPGTPLVRMGKRIVGDEIMIAVPDTKDGFYLAYLEFKGYNRYNWEHPPDDTDSKFHRILRGILKKATETFSATGATEAEFVEFLKKIDDVIRIYAPQLIQGTVKVKPTRYAPFERMELYRDPQYPDKNEPVYAVSKDKKVYQFNPKNNKIQRKKFSRKQEEKKFSELLISNNKKYRYTTYVSATITYRKAPLLLRELKAQKTDVDSVIRTVVATLDHLNQIQKKRSDLPSIASDEEIMTAVTPTRSEVRHEFPKQVVALADDATGRREIEAGLRRAGFSVEGVSRFSDFSYLRPGHVAVVNLGARHLESKEVPAFIDKYWNDPSLYHREILDLKIDSRMRGPVGALIREIAQRQQSDLIIFAPVNPRQGQVLQGGELYVTEDGMKRSIHESRYRHEIFMPEVPTASVLEILARQATVPSHLIREVYLGLIRQGAERLREYLISLEKGSLVIFDSETQEDLDTILRATENLDRRILRVGSAGLLNAAANQARPEKPIPQEERDLPLPLRPVQGGTVVLATTLNQVTRQQMERAEELYKDRIRRVEVNPVKITGTFEERETEKTRARDLVQQWLSAGFGVLLTTEETPVGQEPSTGQQAALQKLIARETAEVLHDEKVASLVKLLFASGGDAVEAIEEAFDTHADVLGLFAQDSPWGLIQRGTLKGIPLVTKSGGFGADDTLLISRFFEASFRPNLAISQGDPLGIGPEIGVRLFLEHPEIFKNANPFIVGNAHVVGEALKFVREHVNPGLDSGKQWNVRAFRNVSEISIPRDFQGNPLPVIPVLDIPIENDAAQLVEDILAKSAELARTGWIEALIRNPINKGRIDQARQSRGDKRAFFGHTEFLAEEIGTEKAILQFDDETIQKELEATRMILTHGSEKSGIRLSVIHASAVHQSLRDNVEEFISHNEHVRKITVAKTAEAILRAARFARENLGVSAPRIAVNDLNPQEGFTNEEIERARKVIKDAVASAKKVDSQLTIEGPLPARESYTRALFGEFDFVIALYHDQGHIPLKLASSLLDLEKNVSQDALAQIRKDYKIPEWDPAKGILKLGNLDIYLTTAEPLPLAIRKDRPRESQDILLKTIEKTYRDEKSRGIEKPRILVAAMNPHAGEGGKFGTEDEELSLPAILQARSAFPDLEIEGPVPADAVFIRALMEKWDAVITVHQDQAETAAAVYKALEVQGRLLEKPTIAGVNVTEGMIGGFVSTSVDHGTNEGDAWNKERKHTVIASSLYEAFTEGLHYVLKGRESKLQKVIARSELRREKSLPLVREVVEEFLRGWAERGIILQSEAKELTVLVKNLVEPEAFAAMLKTMEESAAPLADLYAKRILAEGGADLAVLIRSHQREWEFRSQHPDYDAAFEKFVQKGMRQIQKISYSYLQANSSNRLNFAFGFRAESPKVRDWLIRYTRMIQGLKAEYPSRVQGNIRILATSSELKDARNQEFFKEIGKSGVAKVMELHTPATGFQMESYLQKYGNALVYGLPELNISVKYRHRLVQSEVGPVAVLPVAFILSSKLAPVREITPELLKKVPNLMPQGTLHYTGSSLVIARFALELVYRFKAAQLISRMA
jgi:4-hydroxythreonine-4-phosphate dehydrogenase